MKRTYVNNGGINLSGVLNDVKRQIKAFKKTVKVFIELFSTSMHVLQFAVPLLPCVIPRSLPDGRQVF